MEEEDTSVSLKAITKATVSNLDLEDQDKTCFKCRNHIKQSFVRLQKTWVPLLFCILIYTLICLIGNIVTAVVYFKQKDDILQKSANGNAINDSRNDEIDFDKTDIQENFEIDYPDIYGGDENFDLSELLFMNDSITEHGQTETICYELIEDYKDVIRQAKFVMEGAGIFGVGILGVMGNILSIFIHRRSRGNKGFHSLLISLAVCDCLLIIDAIVQRSIIPYFTGISPNEPNWFIMMYPYFWYPFRGIIVTVTIYMMLAISAERFRAVCYPLSKRHSTCKYVLVVLITSLLLKFPRFFRFKLITAYGTTQYWTTSITEDPALIRFSSYWDDLFTTGVLPLGLSIFLNLRIYFKIRTSSRMKVDRFVGIERASSQSITRPKELKAVLSDTALIQSKTENSTLHCIDDMEIPVSKDSLNSTTKTKYTISIRTKLRNKFSSLEENKEEKENIVSMRVEENRNGNFDNDICNVETIPKSSSRIVKRYLDVEENGKIAKLENRNHLKDVIENKEKFRSNEQAQTNITVINDRIEKVDTVTISPIFIKSQSSNDIGTSSYNETNLHQMEKSIDRKNEQSISKHSPSRFKVRTERSAKILGSIVVLFILTHCYRMALKLFELSSPNAHTIEGFQTCYSQKRHHVPVIYYMLFHLNNLFLVANSSINFIICYFVGTEFRTQTNILFKEIKEYFLSLYRRGKCESL